MHDSAAAKTEALNGLAHKEACAIAVQMMDAHMSENNANDLTELGEDILT